MEVIATEKEDIISKFLRQQIQLKAHKFVDTQHGGEQLPTFSINSVKVKTPYFTSNLFSEKQRIKIGQQRLELSHLLVVIDTNGHNLIEISSEMKNGKVETAALIIETEQEPKIWLYSTLHGDSSQYPHSSEERIPTIEDLEIINNRLTKA